MSTSPAAAQASASQAAALISAGRLRPSDLLEACLQRIQSRDPQLRAWAWLDEQGARETARLLDAEQPRSALHGIPVGVKDVIDVEGMPSSYGSPAFAGNIAVRDADCVARLRAAGAIILGKTVTAEFATWHPGPTANPWNAAHTPGGSSSGSAAAVADYHVPLALGTQTAGSVIRPASFCGVLGFKPSFGRYAIEGMLATAPSLDTLGAFGRSVADLQLLDSILAPGMHCALPGTLRIGVCFAPGREHAADAMHDVLQQRATALRAAGFEVTEVELDARFAVLAGAQALVHRHEAFRCLGAIRVQHAASVSAAFREFIDAGAQVSAAGYAQALALHEECREAISDVFAGVDLLLAPGAPDVAPRGLERTGDPVFSRLWTALGTPCLGFPGRSDRSALPLGLQLIGARGTDHALLVQCARILEALATEHAIGVPH